MAMSRADYTKAKIEELDNLKSAMREFNGERLSKLKRGAVEEPEAGDDEGGSGSEDASLDTPPSEHKESMTACPECGAEHEVGTPTCPDCGHEMEQEAGGEGDEEEASDDEHPDEDGDGESDGDRLAALAEKRRVSR